MHEYIYSCTEKSFHNAFFWERVLKRQVPNKLDYSRCDRNTTIFFYKVAKVRYTASKHISFLKSGDDIFESQI